MGANVAPAATPGIAIEQGMTKPVERLRRPQTLERGGAGRTRRSRAQERVDVGRRPFTGKEAFGKTQITADEQRIEALEAYEQVKVGKASGGKSAKKGLRRPKPASPPAGSEGPAEE